MENIKTEIININKLRGNTGQIPGVPKNPRLIKDERFAKLVQSLEDDPEMLYLREIIAYDNIGDIVVIAGNMRLKAAKEVGMTDIPVKILPNDTEPKKLRAYAIKDNVDFGEDSWDDLANEWDSFELETWGVDIPNNLVGDESDEKVAKLTVEFETVEELEELFRELDGRGYKVKTTNR